MTPPKSANLLGRLNVSGVAMKSNPSSTRQPSKIHPVHSSALDYLSSNMNFDTFTGRPSSSSPTRVPQSSAPTLAAHLRCFHASSPSSLMRSLSLRTGTSRCLSQVCSQQNFNAASCKDLGNMGKPSQESTLWAFNRVHWSAENVAKESPKENTQIDS